MSRYVRVANELFDLGRPGGGDDGWVEVDERPAEAFALSQDGEPRQAGLGSFQADLLQDTPVIADRQTPFVVVGSRGIRVWSIPIGSAGGRRRPPRHRSRLSVPPL